MSPKISIVVPVYNVSKYVEQCIQSLMQQTFKDIEIIVVDDCGQDDSIKKVKALASTDSRIHIIRHEKNQGLSESRNTGLKHVHSEYVAFLDSDDWVAVDFYEKLYNAITRTQSDIAISDVLYYRKEQHTLTREWVSLWNFKLGKKIVTKPKDKQYNMYACACWNKLYKTELFTKYNLKYPKGLKIEDVPITFITTVLARQIVLVKEAVLYYRQRCDSIMGNSSKNRTAFDIFKIYEYTDKLLKEVHLSPQKFKIYNQILDNFKIFNVYSWYTGVNSEFKPEFFDLMKKLFSTIEMKNNKFIDKDSRNKYLLVMNGSNSAFKLKTLKLFNMILLSRSVYFPDHIDVFLFNKVLIDKIQLVDKNSFHYLFGVIPFLKIKRK